MARSRPESNSGMSPRYQSPRVLRSATQLEMQSSKDNATHNTNPFALPAAMCSMLKTDKHSDGAESQSHLHKEAPKRFITGQDLTVASIELPEINDGTSPEVIDHTFEIVIQYLARWSDEDLTEGPTTILADMQVIHYMLEEGVRHEKIFRTPVVQQRLLELKEWYIAFVTIWSQPTQELMRRNLDTLNRVVRRRPFQLAERVFSNMGWMMDASGPQSSTSYAFRLAKRSKICLLPSNQEWARLSRCHALWQERLYNSEMQALWLLISRCLRQAFRTFQRDRAPRSPTNTKRDREFFDQLAGRPGTKMLFTLPAFAIPREIEDLVAEYCWYINNCAIDTTNKHESLNRHRDRPLKAHITKSLRDFVSDQKVDIGTFPKLHYAVARFNEITSGPVLIRRWDADSNDWQISPYDGPQHQDAAQDNDESSVEDEEPQPLVSSIIEVPWRSSLKQQPSSDSTTKPSFPYPEGMNMKSAFEYVYYPFPETRAHEVAQNERIVREMNQPRIESDGPRAEYLINCPPRYARTPAQIAQESSVGPLTWIWQQAQHLVAERRSRSRSQLSSPRTSKTSIVLDPNSKIHKPSLRGGDVLARQARTIRPSGFDSTAFQARMKERAIDSLCRTSPGIYINDEKVTELLKAMSWNIGRCVEIYMLDEAGNRAGRSLDARGEDVMSDDEEDEDQHFTDPDYEPSSHTSDTGPYSRLLRRNTVHFSQQVPEYLDDVEADSHPRPVPSLISCSDAKSAARASTSTGLSDRTAEDRERFLSRTPPRRYPYSNSSRGNSNDDENIPPALLPGRRAPHGNRDRPVLREMNSEEYEHWLDAAEEASSLPNSRQTYESPSEHEDCHPCPRYEGQYHHICRCVPFDPAVRRPGRSSPFSPISPPYPPTSPPGRPISSTPSFEIRPDSSVRSPPNHPYHEDPLADDQDDAQYEDENGEHDGYEDDLDDDFQAEQQELFRLGPDTPSRPPQRPNRGGYIPIRRENRRPTSGVLHRDGELEAEEDERKKAEEANKAGPHPTRADYEKMFVDELRRELDINRGVDPDDLGEPKKKGGKKAPAKKQLIDELMRLDRAGCIGAGAQHGYRNLTGETGRRPEHWLAGIKLHIATAEEDRRPDPPKSPRGGNRQRTPEEESPIARRRRLRRNHNAMAVQASEADRRQQDLIDASNAAQRAAESQDEVKEDDDEEEEETTPARRRARGKAGPAKGKGRAQGRGGAKE